MKPNPEQDTDRAAFEKWREQQDNSMLRAETAWQTIERAFYAGQAAKADSLTMQDVFEQVCVEAERVRQWQSDDGIAPYYDLAKALSRAAPFRKTVGITQAARCYKCGEEGLHMDNCPPFRKTGV